MRSLYNWGRWTLAVSGVLLLVLPGWSPVRLLTATAHRELDDSQLRALVFLMVSQVLASALCIAAALILSKPGRWQVRLGRAGAIALLLFGFPWLILPGLFVLYALIHPPGTPQSAAHARGKSIWWSSLFGGPALIAGWTMVVNQAPYWGLPASSLGSSIIWVWFCAEFVEITVHELGHTLAAWAVGFRVRTLCIGPLTIWNEPGKPRRVQFQWQRLLMVQGGYVGCIPTAEEGVRGNMILVVLCGPLVAIIAGMGLFSLALASPGTVWESHWDVLAAVALLFLVDSLANLIPAGNLDGAHLLHLLLWTERGKAYVASLRTGKLREDATASRSSGDLEGEVALLERALRESVDGGERRPEALASHYMALGFGLLRVQRWADAEVNLKKSLEFLGSGASNPALDANSWMGLHTVYHVTQRSDEAGRAYHASVAAFRRVLEKRLPPAMACSVRGAIGRMHVDQDQLDAGLDELDRALESLPSGDAHHVDRATLLRSRAECEFLMGMPDRGLEDAARAARIFRAALAREQQAAHVLGELALVGLVVWKSGRWQRAADLVKEAVEGLEARALTARAAVQRLTLSLILRKAGQLDEALAALPREEDLPASKREAWLLARGEISLLAARAADAILDFERALSLARETSHPDPVHSAATECALAEACLDAGRDQDAEALATSAGAILHEARHPEESRAQLALARLAWKRGADGTTPWRHALETMRCAPLIEPATRARWLEQVASTLSRDGRFAEAEEARKAAAVDWERLGCPLKAIQHQVHHHAGYAYVHPDR